MTVKGRREESFLSYKMKNKEKSQKHINSKMSLVFNETVCYKIKESNFSNKQEAPHYVSIRASTVRIRLATLRFHGDKYSNEFNTFCCIKNKSRKIFLGNFEISTRI